MYKHYDADIEQLLAKLEEKPRKPASSSCEDRATVNFEQGKEFNAAAKCLAEFLRCFCAEIQQKLKISEECSFELQYEVSAFAEFAQDLQAFTYVGNANVAVQSAIKEGAKSLHNQLFPRDCMTPEEQEEYQRKMQEYLQELKNTVKA